MDSSCPVAKFVRRQIQMLGKPQHEIAREVGFDQPNIITMIKQGKTKLPLAKVGPMAIALETDPVYLTQLCFSTYFPETWAAIAPFLETALTADEKTMIHAWRSYVGAPCIAALNDEAGQKLQEFLLCLRSSPVHH